MQLSQSMMKLVIKMLLFLILLTVGYLIIALLFSARYWPDVYNYINANITIKRIPTISELNITIIEVTDDFTTDGFTVEMETSTVSDYEIDVNDFASLFDDEANTRTKKHIVLEDVKDYSELPNRNVVIDYVFDNDSPTIKEGLGREDNGVRKVEETTRVIKDLIDESKLTRSDSRDVEMVTGFNRLRQFDETVDSSCHGNATSSKISDVVFPWIVSIFIKNDSNENQFDYYCDGGLISDKAVLTAARCVHAHSMINPDDLLVILGKRSLHSMADSEKAYKIKKIIAHENFTLENGDFNNDLAILIIENAVELSKSIQVACIATEVRNTSVSASVAWNFNGDLEPVYFLKKSEPCDNQNKDENTFCATYGNSVALCPNYGGLYATKADNQWYLQGIRTDDPTVRGICFKKTIRYTNLENYYQWITDTVNVIKSDY